MAEQASKQKPPKQERREEVPVGSTKTIVPKHSLADQIDELLDEIDEALAENGITNSVEADQWVKSYVQTGGQ